MTEEEAILATRQHFIDSHNRCITGAINGEFRVNDLPRYILWQNELIEHMESGLGDNSFTFQQYKHFLLTGVCVPLLP